MFIHGIRIAYAPIAGDDRLTRRQRESAAVRALVDELLGADAVVGHDAHGAPVVDGWHISITHSARLAAVAVSRDKIVGIDAEEWRDTLRRVSHKFLAPGEDDTNLLRSWTVKEAVYKAAGIPALPFTDIRIDGDTATVRGLRFDLHTIKIDNTLLTIAIKI